MKVDELKLNPIKIIEILSKCFSEKSTPDKKISFTPKVLLYKRPINITIAIEPI